MALQKQLEMSLSKEVNMTNCSKHCKHFFDRHESIHTDLMIAFWIMAGYLGPIDSIDEAYSKGHKILLDLTSTDQSMLKTLDHNPEMIEFNGSTDSDSPHCSTHKGLCFIEKLGFGDLVHLDGLEVFPKITEESVFLMDGNHLTCLAYFKPKPESLNLLLSSVENPLSALLLRDCELLQEIDISFEKFKYLTVLEISGLSQVPKQDPLLQTISQLSELQSLHLSDFRTKELHPNFFANLKKLLWVIIRGFPNLVSFPSITPLKDLKILDVSHCSALQTIATVVIHNPELQVLDFSYTSMVNIPTIKESTNLSRVIARGVKVAVLNCLKEVSSLEVLDLSGANNVKEIKQLAGNEELVVLDLSRTGIKSINFLPELVHLREIVLQECTSLTRLPSVRNLTKLEVFDISGCGSLKELPEGLFNLQSLKELNLSLTSVSQIPSLANLTNLLKLSLRGLKVNSLEGLESLSKLEELDLNSLQIIAPQELKFDFLQNLVTLQILNLSHTDVAQLPDM